LIVKGGQKLYNKYQFVTFCIIQVRYHVETFTVEELAKYLKLHEYTIRRLARIGKIPSFKAGGQWRFRKDEINAWSRGKQESQRS